MDRNVNIHFHHQTLFDIIRHIEHQSNKVFNNYTHEVIGSDKQMLKDKLASPTVSIWKFAETIQ